MKHLNIAFTSQGFPPAEGQVEGEAPSWAYALAEVPLDWLEPAFAKATRDYRGTHTITAGHVKAALDALKQEVLEGSRKAPGTEPAPDPNARALPRPSGQVEYLTLDEWKRKHGLPADWKLGQPMPKESDLYGVNVPHRLTDAEPMPRGPMPTDERWWEKKYPPWELYPNRDNPLEDGEYLWWVERCVEIDFPDVRCQGYVIEHFGKEGQEIKHLVCPIHSHRLKEGNNHGSR